MGQKETKRGIERKEKKKNRKGRVRKDRERRPHDLAAGVNRAMRKRKKEESKTRKTGEVRKM